MGKRKKKTNSEDNHGEQTPNDNWQISIGEESERWKTVRESLKLSDEELMKAVLDLLEDRRVCPHGCYMKSTQVTCEKKQIKPKLVRTVGIQTKTKRRSLGCQTELKPSDTDLTGDSHYRAIHPNGLTDNQSRVQNDHQHVNQSRGQNQLPGCNDVNQSVPVTEDVRWKTMKTSHGIKTDDQMLRALFDWYSNTQAENQMPKDISSQTTTEQLQSGKQPAPVPDSSYILTLSVTPDQEQAIKNLCLLRDWPYTKYSPIVEEREQSLDREYKSSPTTVIVQESPAIHGNLLKSNNTILLSDQVKSVSEFVSESDTVTVKSSGESVVSLGARSGETTVGPVHVVGEATTDSLVASNVENAVMNSVTAAGTDMQSSQNVYIPVIQDDNRRRENVTIYKHMNIQQSQVIGGLARKESDSLYKTLNSQLTQQRTPMPFVLPSTVALESLGIFPKTTASVIESTGPFTSSTQVDYEPFRKKIDDSDPVQSQKYKKIRLAPSTRTVTYPTGSGQESFNMAQTEEQYSQIQDTSTYGYLQPGYSQGPEQEGQ